MDATRALDFCAEWLPAWTGGEASVDRLIHCYADTAFYRDPVKPEGLTGKDALRAYLQKLLKRNPDWVWAAEEIIPTQKGFTLKWRATIPVEGRLVSVSGLDIVELEDGYITRNEVFFDRTPLLT